MRFLPFQVQILLLLELVFLNLTFIKEGYGELSTVEMQAALDQVNTALVSLQIIQTKQQVDLVIFKHR